MPDGPAAAPLREDLRIYANFCSSRVRDRSGTNSNDAREVELVRDFADVQDRATYATFPPHLEQELSLPELADLPTTPQCAPMRGLWRPGAECRQLDSISSSCDCVLWKHPHRTIVTRPTNRASDHGRNLQISEPASTCAHSRLEEADEGATEAREEITSTPVPAELPWAEQPHPSPL